MNYKKQRKQDRKPRNAFQNRICTSFPVCRRKKKITEWRVFFIKINSMADPLSSVGFKCWKDYSKGKPNLRLQKNITKFLDIN
jgi:hypothetical protein